MEDVRNEVIKNMEQDTSYDFIANNYWDMDKADLKDIILELLYGIYLHEKYDADPMEEAIFSLKERWDME